MSWDQQRDDLHKQAAQMLREAGQILAQEGTKQASTVDLVEQVKQAHLARIFKNLKYVEYCNAVLG